MEDLAYRRLIDQYYLDESPLKGEPSLIARRIGMSDFSSDVQYILEVFFEKEGDLWVSKRCDDEIAKYRLKADSARNANRIKSEKKSALKSEMKSEPNQLLTKNQEPLTKNHIKTIQAPEGVSLEIWNDFLAQRKKAKAVVSETVMKSIAKEAQKAGWSLEQALAECSARGWRGFKAEWVKQEPKKEAKMSNFWAQIEGNK